MSKGHADNPIPADANPRRLSFFSVIYCVRSVYDVRIYVLIECINKRLVNDFWGAVGRHDAGLVLGCPTLVSWRPSRGRRTGPFCIIIIHRVCTPKKERHKKISVGSSSDTKRSHTNKKRANEWIRIFEKSFQRCEMWYGLYINRTGSSRFGSRNIRWHFWTFITVMAIDPAEFSVHLRAGSAGSTGSKNGIKDRRSTND